MKQNKTEFSNCHFKVKNKRYIYFSKSILSLSRKKKLYIKENKYRYIIYINYFYVMKNKIYEKKKLYKYD